MQLKEGLMMTDVVKIIARDEYEKGVQAGMREGMQQGMQEGMQEGLEKGRKSALRDTARKLLATDMDEWRVVEITGLTIEEVRALHESMQ